MDNDDELKNEESNDEKIDNGDTENFELELSVPKDFDEDDDYLVYVKAYEEDEEETQCIQKVVKVNLDREKHNVVIGDLILSSDTFYAGDNLDVFVEVENIGSSDEDVYLTLEVLNLGISERTDTFELEEFGQDDFDARTFYAKIPSTANEGDYTLRVKAFFDGDNNEEIKTISIVAPLVYSGSTETGEVINLNLPKVTGQAINLGASNVEGVKESSSRTGSYFLVFTFAIGIVLLFILIILQRRR